jgi:hypothetical protein
MPNPEHQHLPDLAVGHHPDYGIVAANPKRLAASEWMLKGFDFHRVPGHPSLYALADQDRDGLGRATRAVELLCNAGYDVAADAAFLPAPATAPPPGRDRPTRVEPDIAFAEHPQLGIIAATANRAATGGQFLEAHGWRHDPRLDIYTLPSATDRGEALGKVAQATLAMQRADLRVAVQPHLADATAVAAQRPPAPAPVTRQDSGRAVAPRTFPVLNAAALAASPARAGLPGTTPVPAPSASPAGRPADPRVAFARNR